MTKRTTKVNEVKVAERGYFAAKSIVSQKGAAMRVTKLELTPSASEQLKADSRGIRAGTTTQAPQECVATD